MAISPLSSTGPASSLGAGVTSKAVERFGQALRTRLGPGASPELVPPTSSPQAQRAATAVQEPGGAEVRRRTALEPPGVKLLDRVSAAQGRMEEVLRQAESGRSFSPAELLALQAHVYRASQELDLAGKVVEKATGGVKQVLQTQV